MRLLTIAAVLLFLPASLAAQVLYGSLNLTFADNQGETFKTSTVWYLASVLQQNSIPMRESRSARLEPMLMARPIRTIIPGWMESWSASPDSAGSWGVWTRFPGGPES